MGKHGRMKQKVALESSCTNTWCIWKKARWTQILWVKHSCILSIYTYYLYESFLLLLNMNGWGSTTRTQCNEIWLSIAEYTVDSTKLPVEQMTHTLSTSFDRLSKVDKTLRPWVIWALQSTKWDNHNKVILHSILECGNNVNNNNLKRRKVTRLRLKWELFNGCTQWEPWEAVQQLGSSRHTHNMHISIHNIHLGVKMWAWTDGSFFINRFRFKEQKMNMMASCPNYMQDVQVRSL